MSRKVFCGLSSGLEHFDVYPRPLFRVTLPDDAKIKGVEGETGYLISTIRLVGDAG